MLRRPTHVRRGVELVAGGSNAEALELRSLRQPVEQLGRTRHALGANDFVQRLAIAAGFHAAHEQSLGGEIRHRHSNVLSDGLFADLEPGSHVGGKHENRISREERLGNHETAIGAVIQRALQPLRGGGMPRVALELDHEPRKTRHALGPHRVAFVGHCGRPDLFALERFEQLRLVLQQP